MSNLDQLIELGDPDGLVREIDRLCETKSWLELETLAERCHLAVQRGKQLWGVATHAEYRLALRAPAEFAAAAVEAKPSPFVLGPLSEVAASTHTWDELAPHIPDGPQRAVTAYECVTRSADLSADESLTVYADAFEMPFKLQEWEPEYPTAIYRDTSALFERPLAKVIEVITPRRHAGAHLDDSEAVDALAQLVRPWTTESNGELATCSVEGDAGAAAFALGIAGDINRIEPASALALMAWAAASGGAHGRRRGMASGRSRAWWALAAIGDALQDWPLPPAELGDIAAGIEWYTWGGSDTDVLELALVAVDPIDKVAFGIHATDSEAATEANDTEASDTEA